MHLPKSDRFLEEILHYVKFRYDREQIRLELKSHIMEKIDDYIEQGYDVETAEQLSVKDMGDAKEIGIALNKQHDQLLGCLWKITNSMVVLFIIWNIITIGAYFIYPFFSNPIDEISKTDIVYRIDIDERVQLDDTIIHFTNVIYEENGDMNIFYEYYDTKLWGTRGIEGALLNITDNLGSKYIYNGSFSSSSGYKTKCRRTFENFANEADTLIISYDRWKRNFNIEILLKEGVNHE